MGTYSKVTGVTTNLSVRSSPNTSAPLLFSVYNDEVLQVLSGPTGGWSRIRHKNGDGYCSADYLTPKNTTNGNSGTVFNASTNVNVRTGPGTSFAQYFSLQVGTSIMVLETFKSWKIIEHNGRIGCMHPDYVSGGAGIPGVVGNGPNATISAADIRAGVGKYWRVDLNTTHPQIMTMQMNINTWVNSMFSDVGWLPATGIYNQDTKMFVEVFQQYQTNPIIQVDGLFGKNTLTAYENLFGTLN